MSETPRIERLPVGKPLQPGRSCCSWSRPGHGRHAEPRRRLYGTRVSQLDRESDSGKDSPIVLTARISMAHMLTASSVRPKTHPCRLVGHSQPRDAGVAVPLLPAAGPSRPVRPRGRRQVFLDAGTCAPGRRDLQASRSFRVLRHPASGGCGFSGCGSADRKPSSLGCSARVDLKHPALLAGVSTDPLTTPSLFATGLRPSRTKTVSTQARTLRLSS